MAKKTPRKGGRRSRSLGRRQARSGRGLTILYEDDAVVAVAKPAGLPAVPIPGSDAPSAWSLLSAELKPRRQRAYVVHRIDRFTSVRAIAETGVDLISVGALTHSASAVDLSMRIDPL